MEWNRGYLLDLGWMPTTERRLFLVQSSGDSRKGARVQMLSWRGLFFPLAITGDAAEVALAPFRSLCLSGFNLSMLGQYIWRREMWRGLKYGMQRWFLPRRRWWLRCTPVIFRLSSTFSAWLLGEFLKYMIWGADFLLLDWRELLWCRCPRSWRL